MAFKPIYNTEADDDWDVNVDPQIQVKDTKRLTSPKQVQMNNTPTLQTNLNRDSSVRFFCRTFETYLSFLVLSEGVS